jgi:hypothetical protein
MEGKLDKQTTTVHCLSDSHYLFKTYLVPSPGKVRNSGGISLFPVPRVGPDLTQQGFSKCSLWSANSVSSRNLLQIQISGWVCYRPIIPAFRAQKLEDVSWRPAWATQWVQSQHELHSETLTLKNNGQGHSSMVEQLPSMEKALNSIPPALKKKLLELSPRSF